MSIERTVFSDQPHLAKLRAALWSGKAFGSASVLVGAGFSRNADRPTPSTPEAPDFRGIAATMWAEMHSRSTAEFPEGLSPIDVASDYEGIFGRGRLDDFLARQVQDAAYQPGRLHHLLMSLPWADVFTTNWDTLLERAAREVVDRRYSVVAAQASVGGSQKPRILKLHGGFPDHHPLIVTAEDFRKYPRTHATFVNTVQQAVMENAVCLLGFRGDDPNFLAWSGWVRDHLGESAPPIYLAGLLDLDAGKRSALARRRVVPIDLAAVFPRKQWPDDAARHASANAWLLLNLAVGEPDPTSWPSMSVVHASGAWEPDRLPPLCFATGGTRQETLTDWLSRYPGWLTCPPKAHVRLRLSLSNTYRTIQPVKDAELEPLITVLRALDLLRMELPEEGLANLAERLFQPGSSAEIAFEARWRCLAQLRRNAQWKIFHAATQFLQQIPSQTDVDRAKVCNERALAAIERLDFDELDSAIARWPALPRSFDLELARAYALVHAGMEPEARHIVRTVLRTLRTEVNEASGDLGMMALEGAAMLFSNLLSGIGSQRDREASYHRIRELERWECDPHEYFLAEERALDRLQTLSVTTHKTFDPGRYQVTVTSSSEPSPEETAHRALQLFDVFHLPLRVDQATFYNALALRAAVHIVDERPLLAYSIVFRIGDRRGLDRVFGPLVIARLQQSDVEELLRATTAVIQRASRNRSLATDDVAAAIETAYELRSRLVSRLSDDDVRMVVGDAVRAASRDDFFDRWSSAGGALDCILRGLAALPLTQARAFVPSLLSLPQPPVDSTVVATGIWRDPVREISRDIFSGPQDRLSWQEPIERDLVTAKLGPPERKWLAIGRLLILARAGALSDSQMESLEAGIWSSHDLAEVSHNLAVVSILPTALLLLPGAHDRGVASALREQFISASFPETHGVPGGERRAGEEAARSHFTRLKRLILDGKTPLDPDDAAELLRRANVWLTFHLSNRSSQADRLQRSDAALRALLSLLSEAVFPSLAANDHDGPPMHAPLASALLQSLSTVPERLRISSHFYRMELITREQAVDELLEGLRSGDMATTSAALAAAPIWINEVSETATDLLVELIAMLSDTSPPWFSLVLDTIRHCIDTAPTCIAADDLARLASKLYWLRERSDVTKRDNDRWYQDANWMVDVHAEATRLAGTVWRLFPSQRPRLETWRELGTTSSLARIRNAWDNSANSPTAS